MKTASWKNASPELLNLWRNLPVAFAASINAGTATITSIYYHGVAAATEYLTYDAKKLYVALELSGTDGGAAAATTIPYINLYNEGNAIIGAMKPGCALWNATGAAINYFVLYETIKNVYFGKITPSSAVTYIKFNGFKITIP
jgi:hypothetical protein